MIRKINKVISAVKLVFADLLFFSCDGLRSLSISRKDLGQAG